MSKRKNQKFYIMLPLLLAITLAIGILTGATMADPSSGKSNFISSLVKFKEILTYVERDYVDEIDAEKLVGEAINEMLEKLDPHSVYIPAKDRELTNSQLEGEFDGIGIEFNIIKDTIYVITPLEGGPSEAVGLLSGDKIVEVDGEAVAGIGITNRDVFDLLRGPKGTEVELGIKRRAENDLLHFNIIRDKIPQHSVAASYMVEDEIGYIKVSRFAATTYDEFYTAITDLQDQGIRCWLVPDELKGGQDLQLRTNQALGQHGKLVLILSDSSMASDWVAAELKGMRELEKQERRRMLFPVSLASPPMLQSWTLMEPGSFINLAKELRQYPIPNFSDMHHEPSYESALVQLLRDLKSPFHHPRSNNLGPDFTGELENKLY